MRKDITLILGFLILFSSCSIKTTKGAAYSNKHEKVKFGMIDKDGFKVIVDTITFKNFLNTEFGKEKIKFDKIQIVNQETLGNVKLNFYYFTAEDKKNKVKIARWLNKVNDELILNNKVEGNDLFEQLYLICVGNPDSDCSPQVYIKDSLRSWSCSDNDDGICKMDSLSSCKMFTSFVID